MQSFTDKDEAFRQAMRENVVYKLKNRYIRELGYTEDEAAKMAVAEVDKDFDMKFKIQCAVQRRKEKEYRDELTGYVPPVNAGTEEEGNAGGTGDAFIKGFRLVGNRYGH